ncbi:MAG TPA: aspartyl/asparaginyl beta-hydroxylase domain-containing protein [Dokdonella sp.]|nr:aspartyl/asparaginyl beta-hydroxylase domain-containing protein [Dokdonella sp.]
MNTTSDPTAADDRREAALALVAQGRVAEAERAFDAVLRERPDDVDALNFLAICAHGRGQADAALELLSRARAAHPRDTTTLTNLGVLQREFGRLEEAQAALVEAVRLAPQLYVARLRLGEVLEARGRLVQALPAYFGAIMHAQERGLWLSDATTDAALRPLVKHAMRAVAAGRRAAFAALLAPLRERHGDSALARVGRGLAIYLEELPPDYPDPRQRPKFFYVPGLPPTPVFERELFPWYESLEAHTATIRDEMHAVFAADSGFEPFLGHFDDEAPLAAHLRNDRDKPVWDAFFFFRHGIRNEANAARCPRTAALLETLPLCRIREHSPEVCFSVLTPGSHILPHRGVTNTRVVTHLPLVVPAGDLALAVGDELLRWQEGRCFSFDDSFEHEAWNRSDATRIVMLLDAWNPHLTEIERDALTVLISGIGDFNRAAGL